MYVAPEVLDGEAYDGYKSDMWAVGVVLYTMCVGQYPFDYGYHGGVGPSNPKNNALLMQRLLAAKYETPDYMSPPLLALLAKLIQPDVSKRYTAEEALKDPWVLSSDQSEAEVDGLIRQMSHGPIASISANVEPEHWMEKLAQCRQAHQEAAGAGEPEPEGEGDGEDAILGAGDGKISVSFDLPYDDGDDIADVLAGLDDSPR